jgi:uncharacterized membrane protein
VSAGETGQLNLESVGAESAGVVAAPLGRTTRWVGRTAFALSLIGVGLSTYMTIAHFTEATILACSGTGELSCTAVTTSPQSLVLGIPVALLGLGFFVIMSILTSPPVWRRAERWLALTRSVLAVVGMLFVFWLIAAEVLVIGHICLWCTAVHVVMITLLLVLTRATPAQQGFSVQDGNVTQRRSGD